MHIYFMGPVVENSKIYRDKRSCVCSSCSHRCESQGDELSSRTLRLPLSVSVLSYPENGVVEMRPVDVRPRARTLLRWDQLQVGMHVMVNYNMETPDERGFWFDAEIQILNQTSRTNKELRVKILLG